MFRLKNGFKQVFKDKIVIIFLMLIMLYIVYSYIATNQQFKEMSGNCGGLIVAMSNKAYLYAISFFIFSTYNTYSIYAENMSEVIFEFRKNAISHVIALFICNISLTTIFFVINIILSSMLSNFDLNYIYIMFKQFTITYCLPTTFFIVFGCVVGRIKSLKIMILAIMVTAFLTSPMAVEIYNDLENPILKSILYNFDIIQNNTYPMGSFFVGIHYLYKWIKIIGFITLAILLFYKLYFFKQNKVIIAILGVIFVLSEIYYFQPDSKSWDYERFLCENSYYYENEKYALEESATFIITDYDIKLNFGKQLKAECTLTFDDVNEEEYIFTLYHSLKVKNVKNVDGEFLKYDQNGDYITVYSNGNCSKITMIYEGLIDFYTANDEYVYLPQDFAYYPIAGYKKVSENTNLIPVANEYKANFSITMQENGKIYSNLEEVKSGYYEGYSVGPMFVKGHLEEKMVDGICFICPKYPYYPNLYSEANIKKVINVFKEIEEKYGYSIFDKPVIAVDYYAGAMYGSGYHFGDDYVDLVTLVAERHMMRFEEVNDYVEDREFE